MDQGAEETHIDRAKDIRNRLVIAAVAEDFVREAIFNEMKKPTADPIILACKYVQYELDSTQAERQFLDYTSAPEVKIKNMDRRIQTLVQKLERASTGDYSEVKRHLLLGADREQFKEERFDIALKALNLRIPDKGKPINRPRPSYFEEQFNQTDV